MDCSECRFGFEHSQLKQKSCEIVNPDLARYSIAFKEKQERASNFKLLSSRCKAAEIAPLDSRHLYKLYCPISVYQ